MSRLPYSIAAKTIIKSICKPFPLGDSTAEFKIHQTSAETPRRDCSSSKLKARLKPNDYKYICKHVSNIYIYNITIRAYVYAILNFQI